MAHRLHVQEHAVEHEGHQADEAELRGRVKWAGHAGSVGRQNQGQGGERHQDHEIGAGAGQPEALLAVSQAAQDQAEADHAVAYHHDDREHGLARQTRPTFARQHDRKDQGNFDHSDGDRENQRAVGLAGAVRDDVGVVDCGEHDGHQHDQPDQGQRSIQAPATTRRRRRATRRQAPCQDRTGAPPARKPSAPLPSISVQPRPGQDIEKRPPESEFTAAVTDRSSTVPGRPRPGAGARGRHEAQLSRDKP